MGKPLVFIRDVRLDAHERTLGSKTFHYQEEKKPISISSVAASEREEAQT